ncbi:MAG: AAA family ATPase [Candidatus Omnitrophica bacterium]|nr:AAA family ATPase [Candidatus Omnitrophota bacterium]
MGYVIAMAGKGGTGKTTIAALLVRIMKGKKLGSILAIDADPNSNLGEALGIEVKESLGEILDDIGAHPEKVPVSMSKDRFIEYRVQSAIAEAEGFDLLAMGKPEGPGCYCYVNNVLRGIMTKLINDYDYVVIDNEAGLEHLSRRTTRTADALVLVTDATAVGLRSAKRISDLAHKLDIKIKREVTIINKATGEGNIPQDKEIEKLSLKGGSLMDLREDAVSISTLRQIGEKIWHQN